MNKLTLTQVWSLPDFTIQQYIRSKVYYPENYVIDRLLVTQLLAGDGFLDSDLDFIYDGNVVSSYQLDDKDLVNGKSVDLMKDRFDLIALSLEGDTTGMLYTFGWNDIGQLGLGIPEWDDFRSEPNLVEYFADRKVKSVSCGISHTAVITEDGELYTFGANYSGQLGLGTSGMNDERDTPTLVEFFQGMEVKSVSCGDHHTVVITEDGQLYTFGSNSGGQLGLGSSARGGRGSDPTLVEHFQDKIVKSVSCGESHTAVITEDGQLYTFGNNDNGQLGLGTSGQNDKRIEPTLVEYFADVEVKSVSCGGNYTTVITEDGQLYTFGSNWAGQLGLGTSTGVNDMRTEPKLVEYFSDRKVKSVSCGISHTAVITEDGQLYTFGYNYEGELGLGTSGQNDHRSEPTLVCYFEGMEVKSVSCGGDYTAVITEDGQLYTFGWNDIGQLGLGTSGENDKRTEPALVEYFADKKVKSVSCGWNYTSVIAS